MKSSVVKHSVVIAGHKTSISLEEMFWSELNEIAFGRHETLSNVVTEINACRREGNLSSAIRVFVLGCARMRVPTFAGRAVHLAGLAGADAKNHV